MSGAPAAAQVRLVNSLAESVLTHHTITIRTTRQPTQPVVAQPDRFVQTGRWVRYTMEQTGEDTARVAQMVVLEQASRSVSSPYDDPLPPGRVRLRTVTVGASDDETVWLGADSTGHLLLQVLLDCGHFPTEPIEVGHRWEHHLEVGPIEGTLRYELTSEESAGEGRLAVIALHFDGRVGENLEWVQPLEATLYWSTRLGVLSTLNAQAALLHRGPEGSAVSDSIEIKIRRLERERLAPAADRELRQSLIDVSELVTIADQGDPASIARAANAYLRTHPHSPWKPVATQYLEMLAAAADARLQREHMELIAGVAALAVRWQEAARQGSEPSLSRLARELTHVAEHHEEELRILLTSQDANVRSLAVFALGFGPAENLPVVTAVTQDEHPRVRAWAYFALAQLADERTDLAVLQLGLDDPDSNVRARAAQAVAACWPAHAEQADAVRDRLIELLTDEDAVVRAQAGLALLRFAGPQARDAIQHALAKETDPHVREQLAACAAALEPASRPTSNRAG
jgi:hypothetical protein